MSEHTTVRSKTDICWQRLIRDRMAADPMASVLYPAPKCASLKSARVAPVTRPTARSVIKHYEWLGTLPDACTHFFALMFADCLGGVACFASPPGRAAAFFGLEDKRVAYLARGACVHWAPSGSAPKLINWSARLMGHIGREVAVAYSDTDAGEIGTVYQAAGWTCLGRTGVYDLWIGPDGIPRTPKAIADMCRQDGRWRPFAGLTQSALKRHLRASGWRTQKSNPKWRYGKILPAGKDSPKLRACFEKHACAYPKRPASVDSDTPAHQAGEGGASPTAGLLTGPVQLRLTA